MPKYNDDDDDDGDEKNVRRPLPSTPPLPPPPPPESRSPSPLPLDDDDDSDYVPPSSSQPRPSTAAAAAAAAPSNRRERPTAPMTAGELFASAQRLHLQQRTGRNKRAVSPFRSSVPSVAKRQKHKPPIDLHRDRALATAAVQKCMDTLDRVKRTGVLESAWEAHDRVAVAWDEKKEVRRQDEGVFRNMNGFSAAGPGQVVVGEEPEFDQAEIERVLADAEARRIPAVAVHPDSPEEEDIPGPFAGVNPLPLAPSGGEFCFLCNQVFGTKSEDNSVRSLFRDIFLGAYREASIEEAARCVYRTYESRFRKLPKTDVKDPDVFRQEWKQETIIAHYTAHTHEPRITDMYLDRVLSQSIFVLGNCGVFVTNRSSRRQTADAKAITSLQKVAALRERMNGGASMSAKPR